MVTINQKLYLFGGSGPAATCFNDLHVFDPESASWSLANFIQSSSNENYLIKQRAGHSMTLVDDKLYVIGGSKGSTYHKDFFIIDVDPCPEIYQLPNTINR